ncbi:MAG TPA: glucose 1-dehydrogenase [Terriglobales bacterium]|nr:glucose 1-dehydrogenase [Terriglobales bacterium]
MGKLTGKVVVVTGASKGIGAAIAAKLGSEGANVVVNYSTDKAGAEKVVKAVEANGGKAVAVQADVSKQDQVKKLFQETKKAYGTVDVLVNNAGIYDLKPLEAIDEQHFRKHFDTNVLGLLLATQEAAAIIGDKGGSIINISSIVSKTPPAGASVYSATKGAVDVITRSLAQELGPRKIRVNTLAPGATDTEGVRTMLSQNHNTDFQDYVVSRTPLGRMGTSEDIASAALFLASEDSGWITGEELLVGGGLRL